MDCLFYPEVASDYKCISVIDSDLVRTIGVATHDKKRDRYSYNELIEGRRALFTMAQEYSANDDKDLTCMA